VSRRDRLTALISVAGAKLNQAAATTTGRSAGPVRAVHRAICPDQPHNRPYRWQCSSASKAGLTTQAV